jgi:RimJ/RimL family protein N-acetyltransferase
LNIVPYRLEHGMYIRQHLAEGIVVPPRHLEALDGYSAVMESGEVVACAGLAQWPDFPHVATAWAFINRNISRLALLAVTRAVQNMLDLAHENRIEACCRADLEKARRWLEMLGFQYEGPAQKYGPDGSDFMRFARVK